MTEAKHNLWCETCKGTGALFMDDPWGGVAGTCPDCNGNPWLGGDAQMNVGQFVAQMAADIGRFYAYWTFMQKSAESKDMFPEQLPSEEWFEQFLMFLNTEAAF